MPFLSIVTRHMVGREKKLERCKASLLEQTDQDYEHIIIIDDGRRGLLHANRSLAVNKDRINGEYVYILDDDDYLVDDDFIKEAKRVVQEHNPDIIMVKMRRVCRGGEVLPDAARWGKPPKLCKIGSPCFLVKQGLWKANIRKFGERHHGDFYFIGGIFNSGCSVHWLDRVVAEVDQVGHPNG